MPGKLYRQPVPPRTVNSCCITPPAKTSPADCTWCQIDCSHAGLINTIDAAQDISGEKSVIALI